MPEKPFYCLYPTVEELSDPEVTTIQGNIPDWVQGTFLRTGPGKFDFENNFTVNHYLDGYAMLTRFRITKDSVTYDNKFLHTDAYRRAMVAQKPVISEFGTRPYPDPAKSVFTRFLPSLIPEMTDNCNNSLFKLGNDIFATVDTCYFREIDPIGMKCGEKLDTSRLYGLNIWSAHPIKDADGYTYNIGTSFITGLKYSLVKIPPPTGTQTSKDALKKGKILCSISSRSNTAASICHSFGMTENYIIFVEMPAVVVGSKVLAAVLQKACSRDFIEWRPDMKNRFYVIEKLTGRVIKTEYISADSFFFLHFINCYEDGNEIVVDIVAFPNGNCMNINLAELRDGNEGREEDTARARRYIIPLLDLNVNNANASNDNKDPPEDVNLINKVQTTATAIRNKKQIILNHEFLSELGIEVPTVHRDYKGKKYNIFYGGGPRTVGHYRNCLCRIDIRTKGAILCRQKDNHFLGEPSFVPNPEGKDEDDGILIAVSSVSHCNSNDKCYLIFIDGKTMKEIARAEFNVFLPTAVHSLFLPE